MRKFDLEIIKGLLNECEPPTNLKDKKLWESRKQRALIAVKYELERKKLNSLTYTIKHRGEK